MKREARRELRIRDMASFRAVREGFSYRRHYLSYIDAEGAEQWFYFNGKGWKYYGTSPPTGITVKRTPL